VNTQLDFSRIEAGRMDAVFQPTDLGKFTTDLVSNFRSLIEGAGIRFTVKCAETKDPVYVSRELWEQIVLNLLSNAFKYTFEGRIDVILKVNKKHVKLHVRDTGVGISKDNLPKIFERFTRVEPVRSRTSEGTGIGLTLVKELAALHGGTVKVKSKIGQGTTFAVVIPRGKSHLPAKQIFEFNDTNRNDSYVNNYIEEAAGWLSSSEKNKKRKGMAKSRSRTTNRPTILIIDDNKDMRTYLANLLEDQCEIVLTDNAFKAMEEIKCELVPDLILLDLMLPDIDGIQLLRMLKLKSTTADTPVIILSAKATEDVKIMALRNKVSDFIAKPFSANDLKERINAHLQVVADKKNGNGEVSSLEGISN
jgi:CheY-like chemotaxis protein